MIHTECTVVLDNARHDIKIKPGQTILKAVLDYNLDPPFACHQGGCGTCRAILVSGNVSMEVNEALNEEDLEDGFILTCQARPTSHAICIDYDEAQ